MAIADVTVLGAGVFGLACAFEMARRGARVRVIDPGGVGAGASGGIVGALAPHVPERWNAKKQFQFDSLIAARHFWADVARIGGQDPLYAPAGRLQPVADESARAIAADRAEQARALWQGKAEWALIRAEDAGAWAPPSPSGWLIRDTLSAHIHPRKACAALASAIGALGGQIVTEGALEGRVLHATGWTGLRDLSAALGQPVGDGQKGQALLLRHDVGPDAPQIFADTLHFIPHRDGTVAIGSTSERAFDHPTRPDAALDALLDRASATMPALADAPIIERWAGVRPRARSRAPMLGAWPDRPGHFIANGGFKIGFGMAPGVAVAMADLVLDGRDTMPPDFDVAASLRMS